MAKTEQIQISGELLFELHSKQDWINRVPAILPKKKRVDEQLLWIDSNGHVLVMGLNFTDAQKMKSYPVRVYRLVTVSEHYEIWKKQKINQ